LAENFPLFWAEKNVFGRLRGKIENFYHPKYFLLKICSAVPLGKLQLPAPSSFFIHDAYVDIYDSVVCVCRVEITKYLLFASRQSIRGVSLESNAAVVGLPPSEAIPPIVNSESTFVAVDYDAADDYVYYSDLRRGSIHRIRTNGTGIFGRHRLLCTALSELNERRQFSNY